MKTNTCIGKTEQTNQITAQRKHIKKQEKVKSQNPRPGISGINAKVLFTCNANQYFDCLNTTMVTIQTTSNF